MTRVMGWVFIITAYIGFCFLLSSRMEADMACIVFNGALLIAGAILARG